MKSVEHRRRKHQRTASNNVRSSGNSISSGINGTGAIWRLLACTRGANDEILETSVVRRRSRRLNDINSSADDEETEVDDPEETEIDDVDDDNTVTEKSRSNRALRPRRKKSRRPLPPLPQEDQVSRSNDSFWQKFFHGVGGDNGSRLMKQDTSTSQLSQRPKSPYIGARRQRRKRLVVAMLEDDDGATAATVGATAAACTSAVSVAASSAAAAADGNGGFRIRATRDEHNIRRILQKLSDSFEQPSEQKMAADAPPLSAPTVAAPLPPLQTQSPQPPAPPPHSAYQPVQPPPPPLPPRYSAPYKILSPPLQPAASGTAAYEHAAFAFFRRHRHGYRLFRRIFSPADNYYAVPFPPLETLKFKEDDDTIWEDLEIHVASHKGLTSLKPKQQQNREPSKQESQDKSRLRKGAAKSSASMSGSSQPKQQDRQPAGDCARESGDRSNRTNKRRGDEAAQQPQQAPPQAMRTKGLVNDPKARYGSLVPQQLQLLQQEHSQQSQPQKFERFQQPVKPGNRRAEPLNANRLLSQLKPSGTPESDSSGKRASGSNNPAGPVPSYMRPYSPLHRARWPGGGNGGGGGGGRFGRIAARPPVPGAERARLS